MARTSKRHRIRLCRPCQPAMKWRPIKTAPKDKVILLAQPPISDEYQWVVMQGRWIDLPHTNEVIECIQEHKAVHPVSKCPHWLGCYHGIMQSGGAYEGESYQERPEVLYPTHWMPLPQPPKGKFDRPSF